MSDTNHNTTGVEPSYLRASKGIGNWLYTLDHKRIGLMYLVGIVFAFLLGGAFALLVRTELFTVGETIVSQDRYNQFFTLHGAIMVFLVIVPGIPAALGNFILPVMLGAPDVAFPKLNLASLYLWYSGAIMFMVSLILNAADTGWTFYTPYSSSNVGSQMAVVPAVTGAFILGFSSIFTGVNFITTIHKFRPRGMGWFKMPLSLWGIYATAVLQVLATPVLGITLLLLFVERMFGIGIFNPDLGGDPVLFQHFFWFYSHPAVYIMILPAMAVMSDLITTFAHKPIFGYRFIAYSSIALAMLSFLVWGHHMFVSGQSKLAAMVFSALTFTVAIPSAIKVFNWAATLFKADIWLETPMLYALAFILLFTIGGLTGIFLGALSVDIHLHDTYFVVAHFHYVMMGSALIAFLGGLHYWWPKIVGRMYNEKVSRFCAIGIFIGFNWTFLPQFVMGSRGMPRRYWDYDPQFEGMHQASSLGAFFMGICLFASFVNLFMSTRKGGRKAPRNPWGASTLEWQTTSPPPLYNFRESEPPRLYELYNYDDLVYDEEMRGWVRASDPERADLERKEMGLAPKYTKMARDTKKVGDLGEEIPARSGRRQAHETEIIPADEKFDDEEDTEPLEDDE